jgi:hypothetical protein
VKRVKAIAKNPTATKELVMVQRVVTLVTPVPMAAVMMKQDGRQEETANKVRLEAASN